MLTRIASDEAVALWAAMIRYTRLPLPGRRHRQQQKPAGRMVAYLPLAGAVLGGAAALVAWMSGEAMPFSLSILLAMLTTMVLSGGMHESGLEAAFGALSRSLTARQRDGRKAQSEANTSAGTVALLMSLLIRFMALTVLAGPHLGPLLIAGQTVSRSAAAIAASAGGLPVADAGPAQRFPRQVSQGRLAVAVVSGLLPMLLLPPLFWLSLLPAMMLLQPLVYLFKSRQVRQPDLLFDCVQQLSEAAFYLGAVMVAWRNF